MATPSWHQVSGQLAFGRRSLTNGRLFFSRTGGAISNLYAVIVARHKMFPNYKTQGLKAFPQFVLYTSEHVSLNQF